jgi:tRNA(fMet)-specific endonuclease VapC
MSLFVLDTDILTLLETSSSNVRQHVDSHTPEELAITVISIEEKLTGWYTFIRKATTSDRLLHGYRRLKEAVELCKHLRILPFSSAAFEKYETLKSQRLGVKKMDLYIAAIVLIENGVLVTRNRQDFAKIPDLRLEDWTAA